MIPHNNTLIPTREIELCETWHNRGTLSIHSESQFLLLMATLYNVPIRKEPKFYRDYFSSKEDQLNALKSSSTIYVGNLNFSTTEERIFAVFSCCGPIDKVIMGINRRTLAFCGFCFVM